MNRIIFKLWLDAKRATVKNEQAMSAEQTREYHQGQLDLLATIEDEFNLESVTEEVDYHIEKNF